jgi:hypothetical protein
MLPVGMVVTFPACQSQCRCNRTCLNFQEVRFSFHLYSPISYSRFSIMVIKQEDPKDEISTITSNSPLSTFSTVWVIQCMQRLRQPYNSTMTTHTHTIYSHLWRRCVWVLIAVSISSVTLRMAIWGDHSESEWLKTHCQQHKLSLFLLLAVYNFSLLLSIFLW